MGGLFYKTKSDDINLRKSKSFIFNNKIKKFSLHTIFDFSVPDIIKSLRKVKNRRMFKYLISNRKDNEGNDRSYIKEQTPKKLKINTNNFSTLFSLSNCEEFIAYSCRNNIVSIYGVDLLNKKTLFKRVFEYSLPKDYLITSMSFSISMTIEEIAIGCSNGEIFVFDLVHIVGNSKSKSNLKTFKWNIKDHTSSISCLCYTSNSFIDNVITDLLFSGSYDRTVNIYKINKDNYTKLICLELKLGFIFAICNAPFTNKIAISGGSSEVHMYSIENISKNDIFEREKGMSIFKPNFSGGNKNIEFLKFSPCENFLIVYETQSKNIVIYDISKCKSSDENSCTLEVNLKYGPGNIDFNSLDFLQYFNVNKKILNPKIGKKYLILQLFDSKSDLDIVIREEHEDYEIDTKLFKKVFLLSSGILICCNDRILLYIKKY